jgi:hypothetical protein
MMMSAMRSGSFFSFPIFFLFFCEWVLFSLMATSTTFLSFCLSFALFVDIMKMHRLHLLCLFVVVLAMERPTASSAFCVVVGVREGIRRSGKRSLPSVLVSGRMTSARFSKESSDEWTLEHDWALLDQVPKFTVGGESSGNNQRTFWAQLSAATPLLSCRNEMELFQRCQELEEEIPCGPSPPLLQHWSVSSEGRVTGQTEDGRTIWLQSHVIGRLAGDPLADSSSLGAGGGVCNLLPGGYVEAVGGRVYELGQPRRQTYSPTTQTVLALSNTHDDESSSVDNYSISKSGLLGWWMPATSATVAAVLVYSLLSACIGYGAGLSIIADEGHYHQHSAMTSTATTTSSMVYVPNKSSATEQTQISVSEQRAKLEARVLREQRMVQTIHKSLERDQINLQGLRQQEQDQQQQQLNPSRLQP